jgi:hypothetical protein
MPKDTEQDVVLASAAYWQHFLHPKLEQFLHSTQRKEPDFTKRFDNTSIDWAVIGELYRANSD